MTNKNKRNKNSYNTPKDATRLMLKTLVSTTLRVFVPVIVLFGLGLLIDLNWQTKPWGMLSGTCLGAIISIILIIKQIKELRGSEG